MTDIRKDSRYYRECRAKRGQGERRNQLIKELWIEEQMLTHFIIMCVCDDGTRAYIGDSHKNEAKKARLEGAGQLPTVYSSCETIYVVLHPDKHLIPSAARNLSERLKALAAANKRVVLIGSNISEGVIYTLKEAFPGMQVVQV